MRKLFAALALLAIGCATWRTDVESSLKYASDAGEAAGLSAGALIDLKCRDEAVVCIDSGITEADKCPGWTKCNAVRRGVGLSLIALQAALLDGKAALAIGDEDTAGKAAGRALELIAQIHAQLKEMGILQ